MKNFKKFGAICLSSVLASSMAFSACSFGEDVEKVDATKTQLYVANYNGGYGHTWIYEAAEKFEKIFENQSFESGKTGVQVMIVNQKDEFDANVSAATTYNITSIEYISTSAQA